MRRAPWTDEEVAALKERQERGDLHPYTCPGGPTCGADPVVLSSRNLIPTRDGWVCSCGRYTQNWALGGDTDGTEPRG